MKNICATLLLGAFSITAHAQQITVGLNGGCSLNMPPLSAKDEFIEVKGKPSYTFGLTATYENDKFQFGVAADQSTYKYATTQKQLPPSSSSISAPTLTQSTAEISGTYFYAISNYKLSLKRSSVHIGAHAGYVFLGIKSVHIAKYTRKVVDQENSIFIGAQAAYRLSLTKRWSVQAQAMARCILLNTSYTQFYTEYPYDEVPAKTIALTFPITVGVNYTIGKAK